MGGVEMQSGCRRFRIPAWIWDDQWRIPLPSGCGRQIRGVGASQFGSNLRWNRRNPLRLQAASELAE
jgi:hypothetical protein